MEAEFSRLLAEIAETRQLPLRVQGGTCGFEYLGLEFLLEVPSNGGLALFHAFLSSEDVTVTADQLLQLTHAHISDRPSFFSRDVLSDTVIFTRAVPLSQLGADAMFDEILDFASAAVRVAGQVTTEAGESAMTGGTGLAEGWIRG